MEWHPAANEYPMLEGSAWEDFLADVRDRGALIHPIARWRGMGLDGRNRLRACEQLGIEPTFTDLPDDTDPVAYIASANEHRRHLTPEFQAKRRAERIARVAEGRREGKSTRQLAEEEGVSQPQILRDLATATDTGVSVDPVNGRVAGRDGKDRPATRTAAKAPPPAEDEEDVSEGAPPDEGGAEERGPQIPHRAEFPHDADEDEEAEEEDGLPAPAPAKASAGATEAPKGLTAEEEERQKTLASQADAQRYWLTHFAKSLDWFERFVGQRTDDHLRWYTSPGSPGLFDHGITPERIAAVIVHLERSRTLTFGGKHG